MDLVWMLVASAATSSLVTLAMKTWITSGIKHEYDLKLENAKAELKMESDVLLERLRASNAEESERRATAMAAFAESHRAGHGKRLEAIEALWSEIRRLHLQVPAIVGIADLLTRQEYDNNRGFEALRGLAESASHETVSALIASDKADLVRPFIGENGFLLFTVYRALTGRVAILLGDGQRKGNVPVWYEDPATREFLGWVLTKQELAQMDAQVMGQFRWVRELLVRKLLAEMAAVTTGHESAATTVASMAKVQELLAKVSPTKA